MADALLDWLAGLPAFPTYLALMLLSALENVFPPVPADVAVALGAFLARRGELSAPLLGLLCWLANTVSAAGMYLLGRAYGDDLMRTRWGRVLMPPQAFAAIQGAYQRHGMLGIFVSRFLPAFRATVMPFAGVVGMPPLRALVPAALASALWYAFLISAGAALGLSWDGVKALLERVNHALLALALLAAAGLGLWLLRRLRRN